MASIINAATSGGLITTADTSGILQLQTAGTTAVTVDASQRAAFVAGTAALPAITTTGDTNTGIFFPAADTIAFSEGGTEAMRLDSAGNVGIGTSSPEAKLQVAGGANPYLVQNSGRAVYGIDIQATAGASGAFGGAFSFGAGGTGRAAIAATQGTIDADNVGLTFFTHVSGTGAADAVEAMRIDSAGDVGIGTSSPIKKLDVAGDAILSGAFSYQVTGSDSNTTQSVFVAYRGGAGDTTGNFVRIRTVGDAANNAVVMIFDTDSVERMRIDSDGGYLRMASSSGGIQFNGDTAAANALDDYEEGTWTPVVADATTGGNTGSATVSFANYTKIGRQVTVTAQIANIVTTGMTAANALHIRGLPFTSSASNIAQGAVTADTLTYPASRTYIVSNIAQSDSWMTFVSSGNALADSSVLVSGVSSGVSDIFVTLTYFV